MTFLPCTDPWSGHHRNVQIIGQTWLLPPRNPSGEASAIPTKKSKPFAKPGIIAAPLTAEQTGS